MNRVYFLLITFFLIISCFDGKVKKQDKIIVDIDITKIDTTVVESMLSDLDEKMKTEKQLQDCIFDQATQTDEFLKGIKEFEGYVWDTETKTADIVLNDHWSLTIKRGGCEHFEVSAKFLYDRVLDIEKDKELIFNNIIWVASLLKDFDGEKIKRVIDEDKITITKIDEFNFHANFMDEELYEFYFFNFNNENRTTFSIGYYIN